MNHNVKLYYCEELPEKISQHRLAYFLLEAMLKQNASCGEYPGLYRDRPLAYERTGQGKPYLKEYPDLHFNISHCPVCVACAIGPAPVGVDAERRFPWKEALERRMCHPLELEFLRGVSEPEQRLAWLNRIWSRKESYLKYKGTGLRRDLRELCVIGEAPETDEAVFSVDGNWHWESSLAIGGETCAFWEMQTERFTLTACAGAGSQILCERIPYSIWEQERV